MVLRALFRPLLTYVLDLWEKMNSAEILTRFLSHLFSRMKNPFSAFLAHHLGLLHSVMYRFCCSFPLNII